MTAPKRLRRDAQDSVARLRAAALEIFRTNGLDASLYEIARAAGVSIGTLYHRFGTREGLIDAVIPEIADCRLQALRATVLGHETPRRRLAAYVHGMIGLQRDDPALNDAILRRFPEAAALAGVCERSFALGRELVRDAHADGSLSPGFTEHDLFCLLWLAGVAGRDQAAPAGWQRVLDHALDAAWTTSP